MDSNSAWKPSTSGVGTMTDTSSHGDFSWTSFFKIFAMVIETVAIVAVDVLSLGSLTEVAAPAEGAVLAEGLGEGLNVVVQAQEGATMAARGAAALNRARLAVNISDKAKAVTNVGIGLGGAGVYSGIDAADGEFSVLNLGIDIAAAAIPFGADAMAGKRMLAKVANNAHVIKKEATRLGINSGKQIDRMFINRLKTLDEMGSTDITQVQKRIRKFHETQQALDNPTVSLTEHISSAARDTKGEWATGLYNNMEGGSEIPGPKLDAILGASRSTMADVLSDEGYAVTKSRISALEGLYQNLKDGWLPEGTSVFTSKSQLKKVFMRMNPNTKQSIFEMLFFTPRELTRAEKAMGHAQKTLEDIIGLLEPEQAEMLRLITQAAGNMRGWEVFVKASERHFAGAQWNKMFTQFASQLSRTQRRLIANRIAGTYNGVFEASELKLLIRTSKGLTTQWSSKRIVRFLGSSRFNKWGVQLAQMIDPTDVGRWGIEQLYQLFKKKFDKYIDKKLAKTYKAMKKYARGTWKLEQAWKKAGGKLVPRNRYILGYKVLDAATDRNIVTATAKAATTHNLVLIKFNKINTGHKLVKKTIRKTIKGIRKQTTTYSSKKRRGRNAANKNGKPDIMVRMTTEQLAEFEERGVVYWFEVGKRNGWFVSRGGRRVGTGYLQLSTKLSLFLSFIPVPALRNLLSITSNWVENLSSIARGTWSEQWATKFLTSLERASVNRSARLMTRVVGGGAAKYWIANMGNKTVGQKILKWLGNSAGRELQRYSSATLHMFETTNSKGQFKWKHPTKAQVVGRAFGLSASTSLQSAVRRKARKTNSRAAKIQSFRTKARQVRRIPGAITPNSVFQPRGLGSIKLK